MTQVMITIVAPLELGRLEAAEAEIDRLGNPCADAVRAKIEASQGELGVHFFSLHALRSAKAGRAHLILELSADGDAARAIGQIAGALAHELSAVFALASDWRPGQPLARYLTARVVTPGFGWGDPPGLMHCGSPGMTVGRIRSEAGLAERVRAMLTAQPPGLTALERVERVRAALAPDDPALALGRAEPDFTPQPLAVAAWQAFLSFLGVFAWPALLLLALWIVASGLAPIGAGGITAMLVGALVGAVQGGLVFIVLLVAVAIGVYLLLRRQEESDWISGRAAAPGVLREILARENHCAQNHMVSVTERKPGWLRAFTLRLAFWGVATLGPRLYRPGYLGPIGTIHFARWITPPGTRDLVFFSNYGGSWEAYLEDFITLAHIGLTGVWSNTVGFPKSRDLILGGAADGERFKRYARQSMLPTRFWYSAYPEISTDIIRANAAIRRGLSGAMTEDDAASWLSRFGSAIRPADNMITSDIQSLLFGGLGFLPYSGLLVWKAPADVAEGRRWLRVLLAHVAFNDGRRVRDDDKLNAVIQLAPSAAGLRALGLPESALATFPPAFLDGMAAPHRSRILGDVGENRPEAWWWGEASPDVAVLLYGQNAEAYASLRDELMAAAEQHGAALGWEAPMQRFDRSDNKEPFGFADGGSQPVIRGTYKGLKSNGDPLHLVEPGEFILGYPDNRGNIPPGPRIDAILDPENILRVYEGPADASCNDVNEPRDLGRDGSFLVIRQLEQDPVLFDSYCQHEAERLKNRLGPPYKIDAEFIAAKLMGRWRNGAPLVRAPYSESHVDKLVEQDGKLVRTPNDIVQENSFRLGEEDPQGLRCPFGAHIRRANPRDSLNPGSQAQIDISNRHRIIRIGRKYEPKEDQKPGILFICLNGDIERQFEFVQQTWALGNIISLSCPITLAGERDPILAGGPEENAGFTIPAVDGPIRLSPPPRFVTVRGGGYFFLAGRRLLDYLTTGDRPPQS